MGEGGELGGFEAGWGLVRMAWALADSTQPLLALCHAPSSPPELSVTCQNQSENLMVSASNVRVWTR